MEDTHVFVAPDGVRLAWRRAPARQPAGLPPLLLAHGAASNMSRWSEFVEETSLTQTRDILCLDLRGHGQSLYRGKISLEIWADDIAGLLKQQGIARTIVGGHCLGANVAAVFATRHPDMTAGVVLVEPMLRPALTGTLYRLLPLAPLFRCAIALIRFFNRLGFYRRQLTMLDLRQLDREARQRLAQPGGSEALVKRYASPLHDLKIMPAANFLQDVVEVTRDLQLGGVTAPFLALLSNGRHFADPDITQALLAPFKQCEIHRLDAKHWIPTEQPLAMRKHIDAWCARIR